MSLTDQSTHTRVGEELDVVIIDPYLKAYIPGPGGTPRISQFPGGVPSLTYLTEYPRQESVLRRPPFGHKAKSAYDMGREHRILNQLSANFPYCLRAYLYCIDRSMISAEFHVMERAKGVILRAELSPELNLDEQQTRGLCKSFIDRFVELHNTGYATYGLAGLGRPGDCVQRQIIDWTDRHKKTLTLDVPLWEPIKARLKGKQSTDHHKPGIVHSDCRFDNMILDLDSPMQIIGVLNWELATLGDPLMDLSDTLAYWVEAGDPVPVQLTRRQFGHLPGMLTHRESADYYAERAGILSIDNLDFYYTYGLLRLADIARQIYYRYYHRQTQGKRFVQFMQMNKLLEQMSLQAIERLHL